MGLKLSNNATTTLAAAITTTAQLTIQVVSGTRFPYIAAGSGNWFPLTVVKADGNYEIMKCTTHSSTTPGTMGVDRAEEGTTAKTFPIGSRVDLRLTSGALTQALADIETDADKDLAAAVAIINAKIATLPTGLVIPRFYSSSATWNQPVLADNTTPRIKSLSVLVVAGGGGGAGAPATSANQFRAGGGGGAGGHSFKEYTLSEINSLPTSLKVTVGAGGAGGNGVNGLDGGASSFWGVSASGGEGGYTSVAATLAGGPLQGLGGNGGGSGGGNVNSWGQRGGNGTANWERVIYSMAGAGGQGPYGNAPIEYIATHLAGQTGLGYGVGGGGAANGVSHSILRGGAGRPGFVLVTERY